MTQLAKLFTIGGSQAVRLPVAFRFDSKEVYIRQDPATGDIILSRKPDTWDDFFRMLTGVEIPADFLTENRDDSPQARDPHAGRELDKISTSRPVPRD